MSKEAYKNSVYDLVKKIKETKERLWKAVDREEYEVAADLRNQILVDQTQLKALLSETPPMS